MRGHLILPNSMFHYSFMLSCFILYHIIDTLFLSNFNERVLYTAKLHVTLKFCVMAFCFISIALSEELSNFVLVDLDKKFLTDTIHFVWSNSKFLKTICFTYSIQWEGVKFCQTACYNSNFNFCQFATLKNKVDLLLMFLANIK